MDIEREKREELISVLEGNFVCFEECRLKLAGFDQYLRTDVLAVPRYGNDRWIFAFEVKVPTVKWEFKTWIRALRQAADYPNCHVADERAGTANGSLVNATFLYPGLDLRGWDDEASLENRFYREHDREPLRGAFLFAQHFRVGSVAIKPRNGQVSLKLGTDPVWDSRSDFRSKAPGLLAKRPVGSSKRSTT
ncbi:hypothetical protein [Roseivivax marinus]|uniref:hypothetical protein n=1 Tax=Roseivivax marinus TaxID=1379903 RepID=UPI00273FF3D9|nr:hypothetical protein [Roseivivax marinus]